jgi:hypothetical protein
MKWIDRTKEIAECWTESNLSDILESLYHYFHYTPIIEKSTKILSLKEHLKSGKIFMDVIFSFEDQWMKQSHESGDDLFDLMALMAAPTDFDAMRIRRKSELEQSRIKTTNFNEQISLS